MNGPAVQYEFLEGSKPFTKSHDVIVFENGEGFSISPEIRRPIHDFQNGEFDVNIEIQKGPTIAAPSCLFNGIILSALRAGVFLRPFTHEVTPLLAREAR